MNLSGTQTASQRGSFRDGRSADAVPKKPVSFIIVEVFGCLLCCLGDRSVSTHSA